MSSSSSEVKRLQIYYCASAPIRSKTTTTVFFATAAGTVHIVLHLPIYFFERIAIISNEVIGCKREFVFDVL